MQWTNERDHPCEPTTTVGADSSAPTAHLYRYATRANQLHDRRGRFIAPTADLSAPTAHLYRYATRIQMAIRQ